MISNYNYYEYKPQLNIMEIELQVGRRKVTLDINDIGIFEMSNFSDTYSKSCMDALRIRKAGHVLIEIHESQVADIEFLYIMKDVLGIQRIKVIFEDGHMEEFRVPDIEYQRYRITSTGDLRIDMDKSFTEIECSYTLNQFLNEHSAAYAFGRNYKEDEYGALYLYNKEIHREVGLLEEAVDHPEIIENRTNELLDILGEIISCLGGSRVNRKRLVAIASLTDFIYNKDLFIHENTIIYTDDIRNYRIEQFLKEDYIGREVHEPGLKKIITNLCDEYRKAKT